MSSQIINYSDLLMDLAYNIDKREFEILLLGVFSRKLITRKEQESINSFAKLLTHLHGRYLSKDNLDLLKDLMSKISREDLIKKINEYESNLPELVLDFQPSRGHPIEKQDLDDDDEMVDSQKSSCSMQSLSDEEKLQRLKGDFDCCID
ncbi:hypothetical protein SNE40_004962 [Patella caerulea]|uniref:DED domain-containing protein n=1 Tax=Patella caerulea TaxID=87958 RepID=A0AAN8Q1J6_PATCE